MPSQVFSIQSEPSLSAFKDLCSRTVTRGDYLLSLDASSNVPIYDLSQLDSGDEGLLVHLQAEWHRILLSGPGVLVLKSMFPDKTLLEKVNSVYQGIIESEKQESQKGDHFAGGLTNDRI
jgi:hypothetical protein